MGTKFGLSPSMEHNLNITSKIEAMLHACVGHEKKQWAASLFVNSGSPFQSESLRWV